MSTEPVIKHTRKIFGIIKTREGSLGHKASDIIVEILIIVFAITLSLFLERWRERASDHEIEKKFLTGLRMDLSAQLEDLKNSSAKWISMKTSAAYFLQPAHKIDWHSDSIRIHGYMLFHNVYFFPNANRYESLKSTGKLQVIEDDSLRNDIIDLYQTKIPDLEQQVRFFNEFMNTQVKDYLIRNLPRDTAGNVVFTEAFFANSQAKNLLALYTDLDDVLKRADAFITVSERIVNKIQ